MVTKYNLRYHKVMTPLMHAVAYIDAHAILIWTRKRALFIFNSSNIFVTHQGYYKDDFDTGMMPHINRTKGCDEDQDQNVW
jgi:hypothetical protein